MNSSLTTQGILVLLLTLFSRQAAEARPALYKSFKTDNATAATSQAYVLGDDVDEDVYYIPYSKISLATRPNGMADFTFTFLDDGLVIEAGVKLDYDRDTIPLIVKQIKLKNPQAKFRFYSVQQAYFAPTLTSSGFETMLDANVSNVIPYIQPESTTYLTFYFDSREADIIRTSLASGGAFGINYFYKFAVANTPQSVSISIDWDDVSRQTLSIVGSQKIPGAALNSVVYKLIERQTINVNITGDAANLIPAVNRLQESIRQRCFRDSAFASSSLAPTYLIKNEGCSEGPSTMEFITLGVETIQAAAGLQFFGLCEKFPGNFKKVNTDGTVGPGCPSIQNPE